MTATTFFCSDGPQRPRALKEAVPDRTTVKIIEPRPSTSVRGPCHSACVNYADLLLPEPGQYANEKQLADAVLGQLAPHFHIQREVPGRYPTGASVRLDAVLRPRDPAPWFDEEPAFGVEFKFPNPFGGYRDDATQIRQAADYTYCEFDGYGRLGIFLCPSPVLGKLQGAHDAVSRHENLTAEQCSIEYHRKWAASLWQASGRTYTKAELDAEARSQRWKAKKRQDTIEAGARAEGFRSAAHREKERLLGQIGFLVRMMGGFGVGELMPHRTLGWTLLRSGERLWSQAGNPVRRPTSLRPRLGSE